MAISRIEVADSESLGTVGKKVAKGIHMRMYGRKGI